MQFSGSARLSPLLHVFGLLQTTSSLGANGGDASIVVVGVAVVVVDVICTIFDLSGQPHWQYASEFSFIGSQFLIEELKNVFLGHSSKVRFPVVSSQNQYNEQLSG